MRRLFDSVAIVATILAIWLGLYAYAGDVAITSPWRTFAFAAELFSRASFWNHVAATMVAFAMALAISAVAGVGLGLMLGMRRFAGEVAEPILSSFYTIPKVTLYPVMLLIFGLGMSAKVAFGVIHGMIPVMLFTIAAVKNPAGIAAHGPCAATEPNADGAQRANTGCDARDHHRAAGRLRLNAARRADRRDVRLPARPRLPHHQRH
jgi:ABC-type nitrate/sulfonate/bicarbonate transport system permease component